MTYWAREHEHNLRRLADIAANLDAQYEDYIPGLIRDLADDNYDATEDARARLVEARQRIAMALGSLEQAREQLPEPKFRSDEPLTADRGEA